MPSKRESPELIVQRVGMDEGAGTAQLEPRRRKSSWPMARRLPLCYRAPLIEASGREGIAQLKHRCHSETGSP